MLERWYALVPELPSRAIGVGTHDAHRVPDDVEWYTGGHPTPTAESVAAADAALAAAAAVPTDGRMIVLLSGGASALLCRPVPGVTLAEKQQITRALMHDGRAIDELNCVRKHLSGIKGGRLAEACAGHTLTLAISDVVAPIEDDPSVIGSGPTVPDPSTFADALGIVSRMASQDAVPASVRGWLQRGVAGEVPDSPKPGDAAMGRSRYELIGTRHVAMAGAADDARRRGYHVVVIGPPVLGEAREAGAAHVATLRSAGADPRVPLCVISSGETTVTVTGTGRGGRNQEFVAGAIDALGGNRARRCSVASGPTASTVRPTRPAPGPTTTVPPSPRRSGSRSGRACRQQRLRVAHAPRHPRPHRSNRHQRRRPAGRVRLLTAVVIRLRPQGPKACVANRGLRPRSVADPTKAVTEAVQGSGVVR